VWQIGLRSFVLLPDAQSGWVVSRDVGCV